MDKKWGVWCRVSGGVTGTREAWAKENGKTLLFDTEDEAKALATKWQASADDAKKYATASFRYAAQPYPYGGLG